MFFSWCSVKSKHVQGKTLMDILHYQRSHLTSFLSFTFSCYYTQSETQVEYMIQRDDYQVLLLSMSVKSLIKVRCSTVGTWKTIELDYYANPGQVQKKLIVSDFFLGYLRFPK